MDHRLMGYLFLAEKSYSEASLAFQKSLDKYEDVGNRAYKFTVLPHLGYAALKLGDHLNSEHILVEILEASAKTWSPVQVASTLPFMALYWADRGDLSFAIELLCPGRKLSPCGQLSLV